MASAFPVTMQDGVVKITLGGRLDTTNAPALGEELKAFVGQDVRRVVFFAEDLEYLSSAGLRVMIFSKQKLGPATEVYLVGAGDDVLDVVNMTGFGNVLKFQDSYED